MYIQIQLETMPPFYSALSPILSLAFLHGGLSGLGDREPPLLCHLLFRCEEVRDLFSQYPTDGYLGHSQYLLLETMLCQLPCAYFAQEQKEYH